MKLQIFLLTFAVFGLINAVFAQKDGLYFNNEADFFLDNREYAQSHHFSQTIFGLRWAPDFEIKTDSLHAFHLGANILHNMGSEKVINQIIPTIYYQYGQKNTKFFVGAFPRSQTINRGFYGNSNTNDRYPRAIYRDTVNYLRPNVQGMWLKSGNVYHYINVWIDWTSFQTDTDRETFLFGLNYHLSKGIFYTNGFASMFHNAGPGIPIPNDYVGDNGSALLNIGLDLAEKTKLQQLYFDAGYYTSFNRARGIGGWMIKKGFLSNAAIQHKNIYLINALYIGEGNHQQIWGDSFYNAPFYNRVDIGWQFFRNEHLEASVGLALHFLKNTVDNQQVFKLKYNFNKILKRF